MAFSIDWFLTVPGILITIGVILLIIALIMFVASSMKEKKVEPAPSVLENNEINDTPVTEVQKVMEEPVNVETPLIDTVSEEVIVPSFEGDNIIPTVEEQEVSTTEENDISENNFIAADAELEEVIAPIEEINNDIVTTDEINKENSFEIPETIVEVEHRPIYGGADPLEATQTLPKMDVHHEPYSGGTIEVNVVPEVEPVEKTVLVTEKNQPEIAVIKEPVSVPEETPSIIAIPDEEEIEEL